MDEEQKNTEQVADEKPETTEQKPAENAAEQTPETPADEQKPAADDAAAEKPAEEKAEEAKPAEEEKPAKSGEAEWKDRCARLMADFDNFRKRTTRDREDLVKSAAKDIVKDLLSTADNLARALEGAKDKADDPFVQGVKLVYDGFLKTLADHGATPLDSVGEPFDANFHEAIAHLPSPDVEEGVITNEVQRGWLLHGKLLRAAKVVVSAGKGA